MTSQQPQYYESKEKEGYPPEQYPQAPGYTPQAGAPGYAPQAGAPEYTAQPGGMAYAPQEGAPGYTAQPGGMAYAPQAGAPGYTQQGTVIVTQPGVVTYQQQPVPPSNLILSIFSCICCCWILGIVAIVYSVMSQNSAGRGDMDMARTQGKTALYLSIACIIIGVIFIITINVIRLS